MASRPDLMATRLDRRSLLAATGAGWAATAIPATSRAQEDVSLRVSLQPFWGPTEEPLDRTGQPSTFSTQLLPTYREAHPNVQLAIEAAVGGTEARTRYLLECRQNAQADIIQLDGYWMAEFGAIGCTTPLDDLLPEELIADYFEPFVARYNGQIVGLINGTAFNSMLWYREDWLEEAGFSEPPQDWNDLATYAEALTVGDRFGLAFPGSRTEATSVVNLGFYWQEQDIFVDDDNRPAFNNETSATIFNLLGDIFKAGWAPRDAINMAYEDVEQLFYAEQAAMILHGSFIAPAVRQQPIADRVGLSPNPVSPTTGRRATNAGGWGISIMTKDEAKLQPAADFVTLFAGGDPEIMLGQLADAGYLPTQRSLADNPQFTETAWDEIILSELPNARTRPIVEIYPDASLEWTTAFQEVLSGQKDAATAVGEAEQRTIALAEDRGYLTQ
ncbi:MAG: extracellular solute-binding protein [Chloroflexia bacterium]|nr:extracellular solute-binding protein [Chloroflexia bacterium]